MDNILSFLLGAWFSYYFIFGAAFWIILLCHWESEGWGIFFLPFLCMAIFTVFALDVKTVGYIAAAYIPVGIGWSLYRWSRHCKKQFEKYKPSMEKYAHSEDRHDISRYNDAVGYLKDCTNPRSYVDRIVYWILLFPFSMLSNLVADLIDFVTTFVKEYLISLYEGIAGKYTKQFPERKVEQR